MPTPKFIKKNASGQFQEELTVQTGGAGNADKIPSLDANGKLAMSMMPTGVLDEVDAITASEALAEGDYVNIWIDAGTVKARKADGSANKPAHGYVLANVAQGVAADIYFDGLNDKVTGQTLGAVFLSAATPGKGAAAPATAAGHISQQVGFAISATAVRFQRGEPIILA